jgi:hypothetical protein
MVTECDTVEMEIDAGGGFNDKRAELITETQDGQCRLRMRRTVVVMEFAISFVGTANVVFLSTLSLTGIPVGGM